jgi:site-specific DNA recombinase
MGVSQAIVDRLRKTETEGHELKRELQQTQISADQFTGIAKRVWEKTLELKEALTGDSTSEARQIIVNLMGPIEIEVRDGAYFATYEDVPKWLLVCAAGEMSLIGVAGVGFEPTTFGL